MHKTQDDSPLVYKGFDYDDTRDKSLSDTSYSNKIGFGFYVELRVLLVETFCISENFVMVVMAFLWVSRKNGCFIRFKCVFVMEIVILCLLYGR